MKSAYFRLRHELGIDKPLKLFRKTSASLLKSNPKYSELDQLFLGLSPRAVADRHYSQPPMQLLCEGTRWLAEVYGIAGLH